MRRRRDWKRGSEQRLACLRFQVLLEVAANSIPVVRPSLSGDMTKSVILLGKHEQVIRFARPNECLGQLRCPGETCSHVAHAVYIVLLPWAPPGTKRVSIPRLIEGDATKREPGERDSSGQSKPQASQTWDPS